MEEQPANSESRAESDLTGLTLGDYLILRRLGRGGMAEVYLAEQTSLKRQVAFKVLKGHLAEDATYLKRFTNEAQAAASLVHANIVQIYDVGCVDGVHYMAQEYVPGRNLRQIIDRNGPLDSRLAATVIRQVAAGLHLAQEQKIIHRDIKPENIMLTPRGDVKVADFGLARVTHSSENANLTQDGVTLGTPLYMSPEQVEGGRLDSRTDIYSLGVTAYHMVVGHPPFQGETPFSIAAQHLNKEPQRLETVLPETPEALCRIIHKMMAKKPEDRYQSPTDLLREIRAAALGDPEESDEDWSTPELFALADNRFEATQQLQAVMTREADDSKRARARLWVVGVLMVLGLVGGAVLAVALRPGDLLAGGTQTGMRVEVKETPMQQYFHSVFITSRQHRITALESFPKYFPVTGQGNANNAYWWALCQERLAELYIEEENYEKARRYYRELSMMDNEPQFKAYGLAGLANEAHRNGAVSQVASYLFEMVQLHSSLSTQTRSQTRRLLSAELRGEYDRLVVESRGSSPNTSDS